MEECRWLDDCQSSHPSCPAPDPQFSPTRLIKLYHDNGQTRCHLQTMEKSTSIPYAALSYCWGGDQTFKTTTNTIAQYELDIHLQSLPQGLQDAVCVAKRLGFSHIWIDALCIVQDSLSDKAYEIGQMARVYGNAAVTIAASRAKAVWDGFLGDRPQLGVELPERVFSLPCFHTNKALGVLSLVPVTFESTEPLDTRGWTFQERVLSPRFLEFGTMRTQFTCRTHINQVCSDGWSRTASSRTYGSFGLDSQVVSNSISGKYTKQEMRVLWMRIVEGFTDRALSVASDKLPAIAGMAEAFGAYVQDEYVAGLWRSGLPISLLWSNASSYPEPRSPQTEVPQPSWSWASINGPVRFDRTFVDFRPDVELNVEIQDIGVSLADPRVPFGAVSSAHLTVKAHIQKTEWVQDGTHGSANQLYATDAGVPQDPEATDLGYLSGAKLAIQLILDSSGMTRTEYLMRHTVLYLALFGWVGANSESGLYPTFFGLALRKMADGNFSRVGIFKKTLSKDRFDEYILWFKKDSKKIVDIV
ncbi:HET-domain-containing protein [Corynespora cassiicola Philippines]|uniref:HET-domain-containing protein n=1 Tax=Corynespora cassiicola Philippines TaxID=1448308 RepID=A0A2T2NJ63_CORCC|nr:HET-domain-containing protein [Corynespora cassiicola Philippines]